MPAGWAAGARPLVTWTRLAARAVIVCAALAGLFLMHGTSAAAGDCQGAAAVPAMTAIQQPAPFAAGGHGVRFSASYGPAVPAPVLAGGAMVDAHLDTCLSTPPRNPLAGGLPVAAGVALGAVALPRRRNPAWLPWLRHVNAPPGRAVLGRLCVSRT